MTFYVRHRYCKAFVLGFAIEIGCKYETLVLIKLYRQLGGKRDLDDGIKNHFSLFYCLEKMEWFLPQLYTTGYI